MQGPITLITGANRGLGFETARRLASQGHRVCVTARDPEAGADASRQVGGDTAFRHLDVEDPSSIDAFVDALAADQLRVQVLVNNAGVSLDGFDETVARRTLAINFHGAVRLTERLLPLLTDDARIVMVSSGMGELSGLGAIRVRFEPPPPTLGALESLADSFVAAVAAGRHKQEGWPSSAYRVSKAAMNAYVRIRAPEWSSRKLNAVCPGWVRTRMGGRTAPRTLDEGVDGLVWAATLPDDGPTGGFFRDRRRIPW